MYQFLGLNENLIARIYPVNPQGIRLARGSEIQAPLIDGATLEGAFNWNSPFENAGAESKAPALTAMIQSGAILPIMNSLSGVGGNGKTGQDQGGGMMADATDALKEFQGKTGITKLNSTQIFSGMPPLKITCTLVFRAFANAKAEVMRPYRQLWEWALPQKLATDGVVAGLIETATSQGKNDAKSYLGALMPSDAPQMVAFEYKSRAFAPMVIENITEPLDSPITKDGDYARLLVPITLSTLSALDKNDWMKVNSSR
jgi:hypothetical protein